MFIKYAFKAGATQANMAADMAKLICNTPISGLSADCDQAASQIIANTIPSNWEYIETLNQGGSYSSIIRSKNADGTTYKYVRLRPGVDNDASTTVAYSTAVTMFETYDVATHTFTNQAIRHGTSVAEPTGRYSTGSINLSGTTALTAGFIYLYATNRCCIIDGVYAGEFTRDSLCIDATYPVSIVFPLEEAAPIWNNIGTASLPKQFSCIGLCRWSGLVGDICTTNSGFALSVQYADIIVANYTSVTTNAKYRTPAEVEFLMASPLYVQAYLGAPYITTTLGKIYDLVACTTGGLSLNLYDEITMDGGTYILVGKAGFTTWVLKG